MSLEKEIEELLRLYELAEHQREISERDKRIAELGGALRAKESELKGGDKEKHKKEKASLEAKLEADRKEHERERAALVEKNQELRKNAASQKAEYETRIESLTKRADEREMGAGLAAPSVTVANSHTWRADRKTLLTGLAAAAVVGGVVFNIYLPEEAHNTYTSVKDFVGEYLAAVPTGFSAVADFGVSLLKLGSSFVKSSIGVGFGAGIAAAVAGLAVPVYNRMRREYYPLLFSEAVRESAKEHRGGLLVMGSVVGGLAAYLHHFGGGGVAGWADDHAAGLYSVIAGAGTTAAGAAAPFIVFSGPRGLISHIAHFSDEFEDFVLLYGAAAVLGLAVGGVGYWQSDRIGAWWQGEVYQDGVRIRIDKQARPAWRQLLAQLGQLDSDNKGYLACDVDSVFGPTDRLITSEEIATYLQSHSQNVDEVRQGLGSHHLGVDGHIRIDADARPTLNRVAWNMFAAKGGVNRHEIDDASLKLVRSIDRISGTTDIHVTRAEVDAFVKMYNGDYQRMARDIGWK